MKIGIYSYFFKISYNYITLWIQLILYINLHINRSRPIHVTYPFCHIIYFILRYFITHTFNFRNQNLKEGLISCCELNFIFNVRICYMWQQLCSNESTLHSFTHKLIKLLTESFLGLMNIN